MVLAVERDPHESLRRRRQQQRPDRAVDRAIRHVEHTVALGLVDESAVEPTLGVVAGCRDRGEQVVDHLLVGSVSAFVIADVPFE